MFRQLAAQRHASLLGQGSASSRIHYAYRDSSACSRLLFTRLQHTKVETSGSHANPPPPSPNVPRKAKVDIKPAPVKPTVTPNGATSTSKPSRHMKVDHAKSLPPKGVELPPADTVASVSVSGGLSVAKKDIDKAQEHGVMAPPPPGASWIKRMIHHARELFVCSVSSFANLTLRTDTCNRIEILLERAQANQQKPIISRRDQEKSARGRGTHLSIRISFHADVQGGRSQVSSILSRRIQTLMTPLG